MEVKIDSTKKTQSEGIMEMKNLGTWAGNQR